VPKARHAREGGSSTSPRQNSQKWAKKTLEEERKKFDLLAHTGNQTTEKGTQGRAGPTPNETIQNRRSAEVYGGARSIMVAGEKTPDGLREQGTMPGGTRSVWAFWTEASGELCEKTGQQGGTIQKGERAKGGVIQRPMPQGKGVLGKWK